MKTRTIVMMMALALGLGGLAGSGLSEEGGAPSNPMMEQYAKLHAPGSMHEHLKHYAGTFDAVTKMWMAPGAPPTESTGRSVNEWSMGGKFLEMSFEGSMMGQAFSGLGVLGHDNFNKVYQMTWRDAVTSRINFYEGTASEDGRLITLKGKVTAMWGTFDVKMTFTCNGPDQHTFTSYKAPPGTDQWFKDMEIVYKRAGTDAPADEKPAETTPAETGK